MEFRELTVDQAKEIADTIKHKRLYIEESVMVALFNAGDSQVKVRCVAHEWEATKADIPKTDGIPKCPNGHVLWEITSAPVLGFGYKEPGEE